MSANWAIYPRDDQIFWENNPRKLIPNTLQGQIQDLFIGGVDISSEATDERSE